MRFTAGCYCCQPSCCSPRSRTTRRWRRFGTTSTTPKGARPARYVGLDNYAVMRDDPVFWQSLWNNLWFALGTIPTSIGIALIMALWVNRNLAGRGFLRMAYFTPTVLPMVAVANIWLFFYTRSTA